MPKYSYTAKVKPALIIKGRIEAQSQQDAVNKLAKSGYFPISLQEEGILLQKPRFLIFQDISRKEIVFFTRQLSALVGSGVDILSSLNIISTQTSHKRFKAVLDDVLRQIKDGKPLSDSLAFHHNIFSGFYSSLIRCGEASGKLNKVLNDLADFLEKDEDFRESLRASLVYPVFVFSVGVITVIVLLAFVIPKLVTMFEDMGQLLPLPTRFLIAASEFLLHWWGVILALVIFLFFAFRRLSKNTQGKLSLDKFKLKLPVIGMIVKKAQVSRLMRTLSVLISSGIPITFALEIAESVVENQVLRLKVGKCREEIAKGLNLSATLKASRFFPEFVTNIISIGEEAGSLDRALMRIAQDYEKDVSVDLKSLTRLIEPVIILGIGALVAFIVLSMLLPIFQINLVVK
jgi:general secretion pathway protein F